MVEVLKASQYMMDAYRCSMFVQQDEQAIMQKWDQVIAMLSEKLPAAASLMEKARGDMLVLRSIPSEHWQTIWSTKLLERIKKKSKAALASSDSSSTTPPSLAWSVRFCWNSRRSGNSMVAESSPNSRWPCWTTTGISSKINRQL